MKPIRSKAPTYTLASPEFRYTRSDETDIRATFERARQAAPSGVFNALPRHVAGLAAHRGNDNKGMEKA